MDPPGLERLREHLHRHNRWVLLLTFLTGVLSLILWTLLYFIVWWLFLIGGTAVRPLDFQPAGGALLRGFITTAILLCICAAIVYRVRPNAAPRDRKTVWEHLLDLLLAVPRVTLAIFGTGGAAARLSDKELGYAYRLLRSMDDADTHLPFQYLPVEIPDPAMRDKIILALQLSGIIEIRTTATGPVLAFQNKDVRKIAQDRIRLRV
jgi:hypothetical protein